MPHRLDPTRFSLNQLQERREQADRARQRERGGFVEEPPAFQHHEQRHTVWSIPMPIATDNQHSRTSWGYIAGLETGRIRETSRQLEEYISSSARWDMVFKIPNRFRCTIPDKMRLLMIKHKNIVKVDLGNYQDFNTVTLHFNAEDYITGSSAVVTANIT